MSLHIQQVDARIGARKARRLKGHLQLSAEPCGAQALERVLCNDLRGRRHTNRSSLRIRLQEHLERNTVLHFGRVAVHRHEHAVAEGIHIINTDKRQVTHAVVRCRQGHGPFHFVACGLDGLGESALAFHDREVHMVAHAFRRFFGAERIVARTQNVPGILLAVLVREHGLQDPAILGRSLREHALRQHATTFRLFRLRFAFRCLSEHRCGRHLPILLLAHLGPHGFVRLQVLGFFVISRFRIITVEADFRFLVHILFFIRMAGKQADFPTVGICHQVPAAVNAIEFPDSILAVIFDIALQHQREAIQRAVPGTTGSNHRVTAVIPPVLPVVTAVAKFIPPVEDLVIGRPVDCRGIHGCKGNHLPAILTHRGNGGLDTKFLLERIRFLLVFESEDHLVITRALHAENHFGFEAHRHGITQQGIEHHRVALHIEDTYSSFHAAGHFELARLDVQLDSVSTLGKMPFNNFDRSLVRLAEVGLKDSIIHIARQVTAFTQHRQQFVVADNGKRIQSVARIRSRTQRPFGTHNVGRKHHRTLFVELVDNFVGFASLFDKHHLTLVLFHGHAGHQSRALIRRVAPESIHIDLCRIRKLRILFIQLVRQFVLHLRIGDGIVLQGPTDKATTCAVDHRRELGSTGALGDNLLSRGPIVTIEQRFLRFRVERQVEANHLDESIEAGRFRDEHEFVILCSIGSSRIPDERLSAIQQVGFVRFEVGTEFQAAFNIRHLETLFTHHEGECRIVHKLLQCQRSLSQAIGLDRYGFDISLFPHGVEDRAPRHLCEIHTVHFLNLGQVEITFGNITDKIFTIVFHIGFNSFVEGIIDFLERLVRSCILVEAPTHEFGVGTVDSGREILSVRRGPPLESKVAFVEHVCIARIHVKRKFHSRHITYSPEHHILTERILIAHLNDRDLRTRRRNHTDSFILGRFGSRNERHGEH